jgi:hypothetical protein
MRLFQNLPSVTKIKLEFSRFFKISKILEFLNFNNSRTGKDEEDKEVPDKLTFVEQTVGLLVEGLNTFRNNMLEFCAFSRKQATAINTILTGLNTKLEHLLFCCHHQAFWTNLYPKPLLLTMPEIKWVITSIGKGTGGAYGGVIAAKGIVAGVKGDDDV